jgi:hypothetical protein
MSFRNDNTPIWKAITPSDTSPQNFYGLLCCAAGDVVFQSEAGSDVTITGMSVGQTIAGRIVLVKATGTTATVAGAQA